MNDKITGRLATNGEKIYAKDIYDERLLPKIYKELLKLDKKKMNNQILKMGRRIEQIPHQRRYVGDK